MRSYLDLANFSQPTAGFFAGDVPFGLGSLLGSGCRVKVPFDNTKAIKIKLKGKLKEAFLLSGGKSQSYRMLYISTIFIEKAKDLSSTTFEEQCVLINFVRTIEARTSMIPLAILFSKPVQGQFQLQVKTAIQIRLSFKFSL